MFFCEYCKLFKDTYFENHLRRAAFGFVKKNLTKAILKLENYLQRPVYRKVEF